MVITIHRMVLWGGGLMLGGACFSLAETISGTVCDSLFSTTAATVKVESVKVRVRGAAAVAYTNAQGQFSLTYTVGILDRVDAAGRPLVWFDPARRAVCWQPGLKIEAALYGTNGVRLGAAGRAAFFALPALSDGMYLLRIGLADNEALLPLTVAGGAVNGLAAFRQSTRHLARGAATVTLVFSRAMFVTKQMEVNAAATGLEARLVPVKPLPTTIGPQGTLSSYTGPMTISTAGAILQNFSASGEFSLTANNIVLRNFRLNAANCNYGIRCSGTGIVIEDGEIYDMKSCAVIGTGFTLRRVYIHDSDGDGMKVQGNTNATLVEWCLVEKIGKGVDAHADCNQTNGGTANVTFRYNSFFIPVAGTPPYPGAPYKSNSCFFLQSEGTFLIECNWLEGGSYTIYGINSTRVRHNRFGIYNSGYATGKQLYHLHNGAFTEWSNNMLDATGELAN